MRTRLISEIKEAWSCDRGQEITIINWINPWYRFPLIAVAAFGCSGDAWRYSVIVKESWRPENANLHQSGNPLYIENVRAAAFPKLKGMTVEEAVAFLRNDGFSCRVQVCKNAVKASSSTFEILFGLNPDGATVFGARYPKSWTVTIEVLRKVSKPSDLLIEYEVSRD